MADIPRNVDTIKLAGQVFALDIPGAVLYQATARKRYPQRQFQIEGPGGESWKEWTIQSWHGGERMGRILSEDDLNAFRYHDAEGLDQALLSKWGELGLSSSLTRALAVQSENMPMTVTSDGSKLVVGLAVSPYIKLWTYLGGWTNASSVAGSGAVTDIITAGDTLYAVRNGAVISSSDGSAWSAVGSYNTAVGVAYVNGDLWVGKSDGIYNHSESKEVSSIGCSVIAGYQENVYFGKDRRLYRYDGRATYLYDELPMGFNMTALIPYRNVLFILGYYKVRTGYRGAVYYIISGSENHLYSLGDYSADHRIYACAGADDEIFFANPKRGGADRYDLEVGGITNAPCWGAAGKIPFKGMAVCEGYLFIGRYDNASATDGIYQADIESPTAWKTSGWITTAEYDFGWSNDEKLFGSIYIEHRALAEGQTITVEYSLDGGDTYLPAGFSAELGAVNKTITLNNVIGQTLKLRVTLAGPGTSTPKLTKLVARAIPMTDTKWIWDLRLLIRRNWGGSKAMEALERFVRLRRQLDFEDVDGKSYKVVIESVNFESDVDPKNESAHIVMRLREV